ncbi:MAG TPA: hypothetical protein VLG40_00755 [Candidatus Saccharimonas sp.]|nr:hypothetical protein [Candidatus Saccharimonas sp.]
MGKPKKQTTPRRTANRRGQITQKLKRRVNALLSKAGKTVKATTTKRDTGKAKTKA